MATDYDAPRSVPDAPEADSLEDLTSRRAEAAIVDDQGEEDADSFELPGADLSGEELTVRVIPKRNDEFTCTSCFLVQHRSQLARQQGHELLCRDCAD
ncbi:DUF4193 domain-containing protein [Williamsia sp. 1135]|uniref:DUF4193 domain-containing protein n=1 Tax=Williamsia sp. 1135 TaxID=1889262 RepID=UPI000A1066DC|nr:DUF4193 domain-containing protein [Williamsia sp. 1135]ORM35474.1 dUTPase [Williamsia sp. 1135]ORM37527.1 dUTPase [Williamsia sp. 1135]ORM37773.1 dUTPase [Williamsia sp. 1135]